MTSFPNKVSVVPIAGESSSTGNSMLRGSPATGCKAIARIVRKSTRRSIQKKNGSRIKKTNR